jgi:hypothetical protein
MKHGGQHADAWRIVRELAPTVAVATASPAASG